MGREIDLLSNYPKPRRDVTSRGTTKTEEDRKIARRFGKEFFDGDRRRGYGGYSYHPRFWEPVVPTFKEYYKLNEGSTVLDVGCGKGFMLHDFARLIPGIKGKGVDISEYAIASAIDDMKPHVQVADARRLPFPDKFFDLVVSITTVHNLERAGVIQALREIERVSRGSSFITVDAYRTEEEKERMFAWNLTGRTIMHVDEWKAFFAEASYTGDYYWFIP